MLGTITLTVGQGDSAAVSQKEEEPEKMEDLQEEAEPQVNGEKEDQDSPAANDITPKEETPKEEKANEASEVGFKKVFKFVGFKFTVKKDKTEKTEPVQLLTVKKEEGEEKSLDVTEDAKGDESKTEAKAKVPEEQEVTKTADEPAGTESPSEKVNGDATEKVAQQTEPSEDVKPEKEVEKPAESPTSPLQEIQSPLKRFFTQGLFSSLKKKTPFKKTKEEEVTAEEKAVLVTVEEKHESEEKTEDAPAQEEENRPEEAAPEPQQEEPLAQEESKTSPLPETAPLVVIEQKEDEIKVEIEVAPKVTQEDDEKPSDFQNAVLEEATEVTKEVESVEEHPVMKEESQESEATTESKTTEEHVPDTLEEQQKSEHPSPDDTPTAKTPETVTTEAEILSSQEKAKVQGSPLKKLFTGTGLKKLSGKKQKGKKENEAKLAESGENVIEQIQSSTESAEVQKSDSSPSSPEESTERFIGEEAQAETPGPDVEGDGATSDGERKRDGITPWASFKKLVTPKKRVKRPSESDKEDDANEKPKSATMSSTESSGSTEKPEEPKPSEEEQKMERSIEEPKKKVDTSVSWEALICVGSSKKRARKTSDSDDESPKIEEEAQNLGEESAKNKEAAVESPIASSQEADQEQLASSPDQAGSPSDGEGVSTWESFKRLVTPRRKAKLEDKPEESPAVTTEQIPSDSEAGKEESTFSLKKLIPGRRKKRSDAKPEQAPADEADKAVGSAEEDSDTPAVVPLSEYDTEQIDATVKIEATAEVKPEQQEETQTVEIKPLEFTHETQQLSELEKSGDTVPSADQHIQDIQVSVEKAIPDMDERSPSWISATVTEEIIQEQIESISKHQPLSDIPEEVAVEETTITRSPTEVEDHISPDDTIAQDIMELTSEAVTALEQAPEESFAEETTEMVSAVSRLTESPGTSGDATPVPGVYEVKQTDKILQEVAENIKLTPIALSVTNTTEQPEETVVVTVPHLMASAVKEDPIVMQKEAEAVAICTGLSTQEIEAVETNLQKSTVEVITLVMEAISTEVVAEEKTETFQEAGAVEEEVCNAEVQDIKTEYQEVEQQAETGERVEEKELQEDKASQQDGEIGKVSLETETDSELQKEVCKAPKESETEKESGEQAGTLEEIIEPESLQPITVSGQQDECEHEDQEVVELTPELEPAEGPAVERVEELICTTPVEVTETLVAVEEKLQEFKEVKDLADLEVPADEVIQCAAQEVVASIPEAPTSESSEMKEASFAVSAPAVEPEVPAVQKVEELICASSVEVTETSVIEEERVQEFKEVQDLADLQVPIEDVIQCAAQEVVASIPEAPTSESSEMKEVPFAVSAPAVEPEVPAVQKEEELICASSVEVTETSVIEEERVQEFKEVKDLADLQVPIEDVIQCAAQEVVASIPEAPTSESSEMKEVPFAVSAPAVEPEVPAVQKEEELICASSVEVTETSVIEEERVQEFKEVKDLADLQVPIEDVIQCAAQEVVASIPEAPTSESSEMKEVPFAVSAPAVEPEVPAVQKVEELICASSVEVTETSVIEEERVQEFKEVKGLADLQVPVENVIQCAAQEVVASMPEALTSESSETKEAPFAVSAPAIEAPVVKETVGILKPPCKTIKSEVAEVKTEDLVLRERVSSVKFKDQQETPFQDQHTIDEAATLLVEAAIGAVTGSLAEEKDEKSELGAQLFSVPEKSDNEDETGVCEKQGETGDVTCEQVEMHERVIETIVIEKQSTMIVQQIIQNVVENLTEKVSESQCDIAVARDHKEKEQITTEESSSTSDITELEKISEPQPAAEIISVCEETEVPPAEAEDEKLPEDTLVETETELVSESTAETNAKEDSEISGEKAFEDKDGEGEQKTETAEQAAVTKKEITEEDNEKSEGVEVPEELQISAIPETEHLTAGSAEEIQKSKETESTLLEEKCQDVDAEVKSEKITVEIAEMKSQETEVKMQEEVVEIQGGNVMRQEVEEVIVQEVTEQVECLEDGSQEENDVVKEHKTEEDAECEAIQTKSVEKESCTAEKSECQEEKEQAEMPTLLEEDSQRKAESEDILQKQEEVKREEEAQEKVFEDGKAQQEVDEDVQGAQTETQVSKVSKSQKEVVDVTFSQDNKVEEKSQQPVSEEVQHETSITDVQSQETMVKDALGQVEMKEDIPKQEKKPDVKSENTDKEALQEKPEVVDVQNQSAEAVDLQSPIESTVSQEQVMKDKLSIDNETENVQETVVDSESYKQQAGNAQIQTDETEAVAIQNQAITEESQKEIVEEVQIETAGAVDNKTEELPVKDDVQQDVAKTDVKTEKLVEDTEIDPPVVKDKQIEKDSTSGVSHDASIDAQGQKTLQCDVSAVEDLSCQTEIKEELQAQKDLVEDAKSLETAREDDICQKATLESVQTESVSKEVTESPTEAIEETRSTVLVDGETVSKADVVQDQMLSSESEQSTVDVVEDVQIQAETSEKTEVKQDEPKEELETEITQEAEKETEQVSSEHTAAS
ncbi:A-kinase anchor protein 12b isoform X2 [Lepisosteus oculatus]|uniref:A-kinase anchor protein 12b isoform X2 n=1 Tax=Lepisosteus oculatus TaxID=7918 RepID=UPI0035F51490